MRFYCLTLFPEMIINGLCHSIIKRAIESGIISIECVNIRDFAVNKHRQVDDYPYGGGAGMVIMAPPVYGAYKSICPKLASDSKVIYLTPQGRTFTQDIARSLSQEKELVLLCGHYEGIDERVISEIVTDEISLGDFILTGGELAAMAIIDAVCRLLPGVLNNEESSRNESFSANLLEYPQYTRPPVFLDKPVPEILLSGNHARIDQWRHEAALKRTAEKRPDLFN